MRKQLLTTVLELGATLVLLAGLGHAAEEPRRIVTDETGRVVEVPVRIERIISLAPNLTEILYALGLEARVVAVTNQCDYPPAARAKPRVGDVLNPSLEQIVALRPDVVLGTTEGNRRETVEALERLGVSLYGVSADTVPQVFASIRRLAELVGEPERGAELAAQLEARLAAVEARLGQRSQPRVLLVIWLDPLLTTGGGTFLDDLLTRAGGVSVTHNLQQDWPRLSLEEVIHADPDFLLLPRAYGLEARWAAAQKRDPWRALEAVQKNRVLWVDEAILRPGPRIVAIIEELSTALTAPPGITVGRHP